MASEPSQIVLPKCEYRALGHYIAKQHPLTPRGYRFKSADTACIRLGRGVKVRVGGKTYREGLYIAFRNHIR